MKTIIKTIIAGFLLSTWNLELGTWSSFANNLQISDISVNQGAQTVTFSISWENSWRVTSGSNNWDAVWLMIKYKDCSAATSVGYSHASVTLPFTDHSFGTLKPMSTIVVPGTINGSTEITSGNLDSPNGVMLRRGTVGQGAVATTTITLKTNIPTTGTLTTKVIGMEMVYIPQGDFLIGDGDGSGGGSSSRFLANNTNNNALPMILDITSETASKNFYFAGSPNTITGVPATWPKGQCGFYMMKYEITEGQYVEFLNTLASPAQTFRFPAYYNQYRNQTQQSAGSTYISGRPNRAQNWLSWADISAYLDWACLRPMTETEFEKACRGTNNASAGEYAWGTTNVTYSTTFNTPPAENGTETVNGNCNWYLPCVGAFNGDGGNGPVRVGIYATATSDRERSGSSYYGVMELSGNVREYVIAMVQSASPSGNGAANTFTRTNGNGTIVDATGLHDVGGGWPTASNSATQPGGSWITNIVGNRGGDYYNGCSSSYLRVSDRSQCNAPNIIRTGIWGYGGSGGRGVR